VYVPSPLATRTTHTSLPASADRSQVVAMLVPVTAPVAAVTVVAAPAGVRQVAVTRAGARKSCPTTVTVWPTWLGTEPGVSVTTSGGRSTVTR